MVRLHHNQVIFYFLTVIWRDTIRPVWLSPFAVGLRCSNPSTANSTVDACKQSPRSKLTRRLADRRAAWAVCWLRVRLLRAVSMPSKAAVRFASSYLTAPLLLGHGQYRLERLLFWIQVLFIGCPEWSFWVECVQRRPHVYAQALGFWIGALIYRCSCRDTSDYFPLRKLHDDDALVILGGRY